MQKTLMDNWIWILKLEKNKFSSRKRLNIKDFIIKSGLKKENISENVKDILYSI